MSRAITLENTSEKVFPITRLEFAVNSSETIIAAIRAEMAVQLLDVPDLRRALGLTRAAARDLYIGRRDLGVGVLAQIGEWLGLSPLELIHRGNSIAKEATR